MTGRTIMRAAALPALAALLAWTPAVTPAWAEESGGARYQYGRYCGPGVPSFTAEIGAREGRLADLQSHWPPADDIDAMCFSHDYCFEMLGMDSIVCDNAIKAVLSSYAQRAGASCSARATNMAQAFDLKPWSRTSGLGVVPGVLNAARNARDLDGGDLRDAAARQAAASFGSGEAGSCNLGASPDPATAIGQFVSHVRTQGGVSDFSICTPDALASGDCSHAVPTAQPSVASSLAPTTAGAPSEVEAAGEALKGLFRR